MGFYGNHHYCRHLVHFSIPDITRLVIRVLTKHPSVKRGKVLRQFWPPNICTQGVCKDCTHVRAALSTWQPKIELKKQIKKKVLSWFALNRPAIFAHAGTRRKRFECIQCCIQAKECGVYRAAGLSMQSAATSAMTKKKNAYVSPYRKRNSQIVL